MLCMPELRQLLQAESHISSLLYFCRNMYMYVCILFVFCTSCTIFTARRYASAVLAVIVCLSVRLSVCHKSELYKDG